MSDEPSGHPLDIKGEEFLKLRRACELGAPRACTIFGWGLAHDTTVSGKRVRKFLLKGCEMGDADACFLLAQLQLQQRVPGGQNAAFRNAYHACTLGQGQACCQTGLMFIEGIGSKADLGKGLQVLLNSCDQLEHGLSCLSAARVISNLADQGMHVARKQGEETQELTTREMIRSLLRKGCTYKHEAACKHLEDFEKKFPEGSEQLEAERLPAPSSSSAAAATSAARSLVSDDND